MKRKKLDPQIILRQANESGLPIATCDTDFCENPWRIYLVQENVQWAVLEKHFQKNPERSGGWDWLVLHSGTLLETLEEAKRLQLITKLPKEE